MLLRGMTGYHTQIKIWQPMHSTSTMQADFATKGYLRLDASSLAVCLAVRGAALPHLLHALCDGGQPAQQVLDNVAAVVCRL